MNYISSHHSWEYCTYLTRIWELITVSFSAREHKYKAQVQPLSIDNEEDMMQDIKEIEEVSHILSCPKTNKLSK
jgi:hypothetical protein